MGLVSGWMEAWSLAGSVAEARRVCCVRVGEHVFVSIRGGAGEGGVCHELSGGGGCYEQRDSVFFLPVFRVWLRFFLVGERITVCNSASHGAESNFSCAIDVRKFFFIPCKFEF